MENILLKDLVTRVVNKNKNSEKYRYLTISAQNGLIDQEEFFSKSIGSSDTSNYYVITNGDFAYNKSYSNGYPYGAIKKLDRYESGILSPLYICFTPIKNKVDADYLSQLFESSVWHKHIHSICTEGARNHGILNMGINDFFDMKLQIPFLENQVKIGSLLTTMDKLIEDKEMLINSFEINYNYLLNEVINNSDHTTELHNIAKIQGGYAFKTLDFKENGKYRIIKIGDINNLNNSDSFGGKYCNLEINDNFKANDNETVIALSGATFGKTAVIQDNSYYYLNQRTASITSTNNSQNYLNAILKSDNFKKYIQSIPSQSAQPNISNKDLEAYLVPLHSVKNMDKYGDLLSSMDKIIDLHKQELEQLKLKKKYYLNKIFN